MSSTYTVRRHNPDTSQTAQSVSTGAVQFTVANESFASISNLQNFILIASSAGTGTLATANVGAVVPLTAADLALSNDNRTLTISNLTSKTLPTGANVTNGNLMTLIASVTVSGAAVQKNQKHYNLTKQYK